MQLLPYDTFTLHTHQSLSAVIARLEAQIQVSQGLLWRPRRDRTPYAGTLSQTGFEICRVIHYRNSFLPHIRGRFESAAAGTTVRIRMSFHPFITAFLLFWLSAWYSICIPVFAIGIFSGDIGIEATIFLGAPIAFLFIAWSTFWAEAKRSRQELTEMILGYSDDQPPAPKFQITKVVWWLAIAAILIGNAIAVNGLFSDGLGNSVPAAELKHCSQATTQSPYCDFSQVQTITGHPKASTIALSADGQTLVSGGPDKAIKLWDVQTGQLKRTLQSDSGTIQSLAIAPDNRTVVSGGGDRMVRIWNLTSEQPPKLLKGHTSQSVISAAISADGKTIISGGYDHLKLWDLATGKLQATLPEPQETSTQVGPITFHWSAPLFHIFSLSADGRSALVELGSRLVLWDLTTAEKTPLPRQGFSRTNAALLSLDGKTVVTTSYTQPKTYLKIWDLATGELKAKRVISTARESWGYGERLTLSRDRIFASTPAGLQVWDLETAEPEATLKVKGMSNLMVSADGKQLIGLTEDSSLQGTQIEVWQRP